MKLLHRLFIRKDNSTSNEYTKMLKEYRKLQRKEKELQDKLDLLIQDKISYQIDINNLKKETYHCKQCDILKEKIKHQIIINKELIAQKEEIKKEFLNIKKESVTYIIKNGKYFILDNNGNLFILSKCSKNKDYNDNKCNEISSISNIDILSRFINNKESTTPFI